MREDAIGHRHMGVVSADVESRAEGQEKGDQCHGARQQHDAAGTKPHHVPATASMKGNPRYRSADVARCCCSERCKPGGGQPLECGSARSHRARRLGTAYGRVRRSIHRLGTKERKGHRHHQQDAPARMAHVPNVLAYGHRPVSAFRSAKRKSTTAIRPNSTVLAKISDDTRNCAVQTTARSTPARAGRHRWRTSPS